MLRRLLLLLFILANLTTQVSVAYSCAMMGGAPGVLKHCCCNPVEKTSHGDEAPSEKGCCDQVVDVSDGPGDHVGSLQAETKLPDYKPQPLPAALLPVLFAIALPSQSHAITWEPSRDHSLYGTDLYLRTQRLRL